MRWIYKAYLKLFLTKQEMLFLLKLEEKLKSRNLQKDINEYGLILGRRALRWGCMGFIMGAILMCLILIFTIC